MRNKVDNVNKKTNTRADDVFESLHRVMHQFRGLQFRALRDSDDDLTPMETRTLGFFSRHPMATQSELVAHTGRDKAQMARLISGLKEKGLINAQTNDEDRRSARLSLTEAGQTLWAKMHAQAHELRSKAIAQLSHEECETLIKLLQKIDQSFE